MSHLYKWWLLAGVSKAVAYQQIIKMKYGKLKALFRRKDVLAIMQTGNSKFLIYQASLDIASVRAKQRINKQDQTKNSTGELSLEMRWNYTVIFGALIKQAEAVFNVQYWYRQKKNAGTIYTDDSFCLLQR